MCKHPKTLAGAVNMNERIRELALQAKLGPALLLRHWGNIDVLTDSEQEGLEQIEKFAELIVREMCNMMEQCEDDCYSIEPSERPTAYIEWLYDWRTRFEKHFGVEE